MHQGNSIRTLTPTPAAGPLVDDRCRAGEPSPSTTGAPRQRTVISRTAPSVRVEAGAFKAFSPGRGGRGAHRAAGAGLSVRAASPSPGAACVRADLMPRKRAPGAQAYRRAACATTLWTATARERASRLTARGEPNLSKRARDQPPAMHQQRPQAHERGLSHARTPGSNGWRLEAGAGPVVGFTLSL